MLLNLNILSNILTTFWLPLSHLSEAYNIQLFEHWIRYVLIHVTNCLRVCDKREFTQESGISEEYLSCDRYNKMSPTLQK